MFFSNQRSNNLGYWKPRAPTHSQSSAMRGTAIGVSRNRYRLSVLYALARLRESSMGVEPGKPLSSVLFSALEAPAAGKRGSSVLFSAAGRFSCGFGGPLGSRPQPTSRICAGQEAVVPSAATAAPLRRPAVVWSGRTNYSREPFSQQYRCPDVKKHRRASFFLGRPEATNNLTI